jgi:cobalt-zinc-cadmium efflux system outer membrane protein
VLLPSLLFSFRRDCSRRDAITFLSRLKSINKNMKTSSIILGVAWTIVIVPAVNAALPAKSFDPVAGTVKARTGHDLTWQEDADARDATLHTVRNLLKKPLTANRAAQIALLNNPGLQAVFEEVGISAAELREAGMLKNPSLDVSIRFPDRPPSATDAEEGVVFNILDLLMLPLRKHVAAGQLEIAQLHASDEALKLVAETKAAIYTLQADEQIVTRTKVMMEANTAALDLSKKQHDAGNINDLALLQQQTSNSQARIELMMAEAEVSEHREKINRLLGLRGADMEWMLSSELPPLPAGDPMVKGLEFLAVSQRLDLAAAQREVSVQAQSLGLTKTYRFIGALDMGVDTEHNPDHSNVTGPTFRLELPVFNQGQARIARGQAGLRRAERQYESLEVDARSDVRELCSRLASKRAVAVLYRDELLPDRDAIIKLSLIHYNGMLLGAYDLFTAKTEELHTARDYVEALRDYWITRAELECVVGGRLEANSKTLTQNSKTK